MPPSSARSIAASSTRALSSVSRGSFPRLARVGASWRQTRTVFGREHAQVLRIVVWSPPHRLETVARGSGARYTTTYRLEALDDATQITMRFEVVATNVLGSLVQRLFGRRLMASTRKAMEHDLEDIASAAERASLA